MISWTVYIIVGLILFYILYLGVEGISRGMRAKKINKSKNLVIGFGITNKTIGALKKADGLVVGSLLCKEIEKSLKKRQNPVIKLNKMVKGLRKKIS